MSASLGLVIYAAVKPIFKIYFIIGMGFFLAKRNILPVTTCRDISDLIVTAIMPCLIFNNIVSYLSSSDIKSIGIIFFEGTLLFGVGAGLGLLTHYVCKSPKAWFGGLVSVGLFPNISDLPIAYLQTLAKTGSLFTAKEGNKGVAYVCIFLASQVFYQFSLGLYKLIRYDFRDQLAAADAEEKVGTSTETASTSDVSKKSACADEKDQHEASAKTSAKTSSKTSSKTSAKVSEAAATNDGPKFSPRYSDDSGSIASDDLEAKSLTEGTGKDANKHPPTTMGSDHRNSTATSTCASHVRRRRSSSIAIDNPLYMTSSRAADSRSSVVEDMGDLIVEYSEFQRLKTHETQRSQRSQAVADDDESSQEYPVAAPVEATAPLSKRIRAHVISTLKNFLAPNSVTLIISLIIAMSPPLKALFVSTKFHIAPAPDKQPPLSFVMDIASYVGAASVPLGLLILGATIARLKVNAIVPGFWKTAVMITACRLIVMPIFGVGLTTGLQKAGWYGDDRLIRFVSVLEFGLPNATALVYFTAFYTDPNSPDHLQMDCLAICLIAQYAILFVSLPFLVTFSLKVSLGF
ncbi:hypothetical protein JCM33374_g3178 [Metschnikowia sp. JCM 33374]|nr:hypothetical protein JCM33374_g3178 [Metschnikowia sp. JCM 33374]